MEENTSKSIQAKIRALKSEHTQVKMLYGNKITQLKQRELQLRNKTMAYRNFPAKFSEKATVEWKAVREEINELTAERDRKISGIEKELAKLKEDYRENYEKYKAQDKKVTENKIKDFKFYISTHKIHLIVVASLLLIFGIIIINDSIGVACPNDFVGLSINDATRLAEERGLKSDVWGETYDPGARDEQKVTFVSAVYYADGTQNYNYNKYTDSNMLLKSGYTISFETTDRTEAQQLAINECQSKGDNFRYIFNNGKVECYAEKTDEEKQSECEASGKWYRDGQCKSPEEWELHYQWQDAHTACKKYGANAYAKTLTDCYAGDEYKGLVNEKPTENANAEPNTEPSFQQEESEGATQSQITTKQDNGEELPDDISPYDIKALCERGFESIGYTNASIKMTSQYAMGYPPYIYVIVGTLSAKAGITSSRQQVGTIQCQANWSSWTIKHLSINGNRIY